MWSMGIDNFLIKKYKGKCYTVIFTSKTPAEDDSVNVYLKPKLANLINKSFTARCLKSIAEAIISNDYQEFRYSLSSKIER